MGYVIISMVIHVLMLVAGKILLTAEAIKNWLAGSEKNTQKPT